MRWPFKVSRETYARYYPPGVLSNPRVYELIREFVPSDSRILDLGAGEGVEPGRDLKPHFKEVCGVDIDPDVLENPCLHEAKLLDDDLGIPYTSDFFDAVISDYVFEHVQDPDRLLSEAARVLKPGGKLFFRTINTWHPLSIVARMIPRRLSAYLARRLGHAEFTDTKTHETYFRLNSLGAIERHAERSGFAIKHLDTVETHPIYFHLFGPAWFAGVFAERIMNKFSLFSPFRMQIHGYMERT